MTTSTKIIATIAVLGVILGVWALSRPMSSVSSGQFGTTNSNGGISNTNAPAANTSLVNGVLLPNPSVYDYLVSRVFLYTDNALGFGNATKIPTLQQGNRVAITASSSIVCSFQNPNTTATSTFEFSTTIASTSANAGSLVVGTASTSLATTTAYGTLALAAGAQLTWGTEGTTTTGNRGTVPPSGWLNLGGVAGSQTMLAQLGGACNVIWTSTN